MPGHESTVVVVLTLQFEERTLAHKVPRISFISGSLMRKTENCNAPAITACFICLRHFCDMQVYVQVVLHVSTKLLFSGSFIVSSILLMSHTVFLQSYITLNPSNKNEKKSYRVTTFKVKAIGLSLLSLICHICCVVLN